MSVLLERNKLLYIAGDYGKSKRTKRAGYRWFARYHGPIVVKRDQFKRGYDGKMWRIRHWMNGRFTVVQLND